MMAIGKDNFSRKKILVAYLLSHIINVKKIDSIDKIKINRLIYLLWLEYAYLYEENKIPQTSPMQMLEFYNYELGPVELSVDEKFSSVIEHLKTVGIPKFKEVGFNPSEQVPVLNACSFVRRRCVPRSTKELAEFIVNNLPSAWNRPRYNKIEFDKLGVFQREMQVYKNKRSLLKAIKTR